MKNILIGQSGGPTAVINASLYGVIKKSLENTEKIGKIYGMVNGIEGFLQGKVYDVKENLNAEEIELLKNTPGAFLGSCRYKMPSNFSDPVYQELFKKFKEYNIGYVLYIGGNDSMDTTNKLATYASMIMSGVKILGIPKTIDNDLMGTDHTPGFGSAAKFVASMVRDITIDAEVYDKKSVTIVEIMGRHAGWLTASSILARKYAGDNPKLIYLPEVDFDENEFLGSVNKEFEKRKNVIVCVSEGIKDKSGTLICEYASKATLDTFGHKNLSGCGKYLERLVADKLGVKARSVELNVTQRCSEILASETDILEAIECGSFAVEEILKGETGKMVGIKRVGDYELTYELNDVKEICNKEKAFNKEWINDEKNGIKDEFINYVEPLIMGEPKIKYEKGLPKYVYRKV
ncbi:MAG: 6-phosphofructokinase [Clostridia bacterium]|nr:6-phosphofructokinase [Clostridia bacterium]